MRGGDRIRRAVIGGMNDLPQPAEVHARLQLGQFGGSDESRLLAPVPLFRHAPDEFRLK